MRLSEG